MVNVVDYNMMLKALQFLCYYRMCHNAMAHLKEFIKTFSTQSKNTTPMRAT